MSIEVKSTLAAPKRIGGMQSPAFVLTAVGISSFMVTLDVTAVNVALPSIGDMFGLPLSALQWVASAYTLVFASLLLTAGASSDRWGARPVFLGALTFFTLASAACGLAHSVAELIAARAVQGLGAAAILPSSMALLTNAFPQANQRARAVAIWSGISATALVAGPLIGGFLVQTLGWRSIFFVNIPVCLVVLSIAAISAGKPATHRRAFDPAGQLLAVVALFTITFSTIEARQYGWTSPAIVGALAIGVAASLLFIAVEHRRQEPMLPLSLFRSRTFSASVGAAFLYNLSYYGALFVLPVALQAQGYSPLSVGVLLIPMTLSTAVFATASGWIVNAIGARLLAALGMLAGVLGAAILATFGFTSSSMSVGGLLIGMGGGTLPLIVAAALSSLPPELVGVGSGVLNAARQSGGAMGIAVLGALLQGATLKAGLALAMIAAVFLAGAVLTFFFMREGTRPK
ncbi:MULTISPECIES: DHA2 family efflux MFS transporter permease subunit [Thiomonas]|nr:MULTISPECIES: DHA2 family efflux MFS transporter permease subunit [Thiomonas]MBN8744636.1 DHA2 family efflux MFS transporter permease subunit [Thiomonas arsenitoxydans]ODU91451.1 MAG: hypothetical protein ABT24_14715 [Thiomonas sp. SCN 64-16]